MTTEAAADKEEEEVEMIGVEEAAEVDEEEEDVADTMAVEAEAMGTAEIVAAGVVLIAVAATTIEATMAIEEVVAVAVMEVVTWIEEVIEARMEAAAADTTTDEVAVEGTTTIGVVVVAKAIEEVTTTIAEGARVAKDEAIRTLAVDPDGIRIANRQWKSSVNQIQRKLLPVLVFNCCRVRSVLHPPLWHRLARRRASLAALAQGKKS